MATHNILIPDLPNEIGGAIIYELPLLDLYRLRWVSRKWKSFIETEARTCEKLFLLPHAQWMDADLGVRASCVKTLWQPLHRNITDGTFVWNVVEVNPFLGASTSGRNEYNTEPRAFFLELNCATVIALSKRPEGLWKSMLLTSPPVTRVKVEVSWYCPRSIQRSTVQEVSKEVNAEGVTLGALASTITSRRDYHKWGRCTGIELVLWIPKE